MSKVSPAKTNPMRYIQRIEKGHHSWKVVLRRKSQHLQLQGKTIGAMYRWLIEQRYVLANPFSGIKVKGASHAAPMDTVVCLPKGNGP